MGPCIAYPWLTSNTSRLHSLRSLILIVGLQIQIQDQRIWNDSSRENQLSLHFIGTISQLQTQLDNKNSRATSLPCSKTWCDPAMFSLYLENEFDHYFSWESKSTWLASIILRAVQTQNLNVFANDISMPATIIGIVQRGDKCGCVSNRLLISRTCGHCSRHRGA